MIFTFSQVHFKNPLKSGIYIFQSLFKYFKIPYPDWYEEHNKVDIPLLENIERFISKFGRSYKIKRYQGILGLFSLGLITILTSSLLSISKRRKSKAFTALTYIINRVLDYLFYIILRIIDIPPMYSFLVILDL